MLLALDTATGAVSVAVHDGRRVLAEVTTVEARRHVEILAPSIRRACDDAGVTPADLDAVAVGVGPGPFTGLRVAVVCALTLGHTLDIPVHGVCSLDAIAYEVAARGLGGPEVLVATDARRKEVYWARYVLTGNAVRRVDHAAVAKPADLPEPARRLPTAGRGPSLYPECFPEAIDVLDVSAGALASFAESELAAGHSLLPVRPLYLRQPDAAPAAARKSVLP